MKNNKNTNISPESEDTDDINLLLDDFKTAFKKEYIIPIINKMIYIIQNNNASDTINEFNFNHFHSLIKVAKIHDQFEYLKFIQQNINLCVTVFNKLIRKDMKIFCINQIVKISDENI